MRTQVQTVRHASWKHKASSIYKSGIQNFKVQATNGWRRKGNKTESKKKKCEMQKQRWKWRGTLRTRKDQTRTNNSRGKISPDNRKCKRCRTDDLTDETQVYSEKGWERDKDGKREVQTRHMRSKLNNQSHSIDLWGSQASFCQIVYK